MHRRNSSCNTGLMAIAVGLVLAGCSSDVESERERAASLAGSADLAASEWLAGDVPSHFAQRALATAAQRLSDGLDEVRSSAEGGDDEDGRLLDPLASLKRAVDRVANALAVTDRDKTRASLD